jgi:hypothetical protein
MVEMIRGAAPGIATAIDVAGVGRVVDIGGGYGPNERKNLTIVT